MIIKLEDQSYFISYHHDHICVTWQNTIPLFECMVKDQGESVYLSDVQYLFLPHLKTLPLRLVFLDRVDVTTFIHDIVTEFFRCNFDRYINTVVENRKTTKHSDCIEVEEALEVAAQ
jgi:hypothetical protein